MKITAHVKNKIIILILFLIILFAAYLGLYAQDIAYNFENHITPIKTLTIVTLTSIGLFILTFVVETILLATKHLKPTSFIYILLINVIVGIFISIFSLFVLFMWWN